jgi:hypothetical protein
MKRVIFAVAILAVLLPTAAAQASPNRVAQADAPARSNYTSFYTSVSAYVLSYTGTLQVNGYASYRDYNCSYSYSCDRNVMVRFTVYRGYSTYGVIVARTYGQTGRYGSSVSSSFRIPTCRMVPRYQTVTYTIEMVAVAPNGQQRTSTTSAYLRSCA